MVYKNLPLHMLYQNCVPDEISWFLKSIECFIYTFSQSLPSLNVLSTSKFSITNILIRSIRFLATFKAE